jgi:hypothetical protein
LTWIKDVSFETSEDGIMKPEPSAIDALRTRLIQVEAELVEAQRRMPAHSIKPVFMAALMDLEDERDSLLERIRTLSESSS